MGNSALQPLPIQYLVKNNLKLFTNWYPWSECIPCTPKDQLNSSREPAKDGFQIRIGICYVTPIDRSRAVKPGMLATETGETLKLYTKPGLTCRSHLIKDSVLKYGPIEIQKRPSEIKIRQCVQTCPDIGFSDAASSTESSTPVLSGLPRFPKRITIRVNEGEPLVITCPVRNSAEKPITWFYAPENYEELMQLTKTAYNLTTVGQYGSPTQYLAAKLKQVDFPTLIRQTRGRYKIDSAYNIIVAEAMLIKEERYRGLHHLICVHGDARAVHIKNNNDNNSSNHSKGYIYGEWSGIIHIDTIPRNTFVVFLSKLTPVIQLLIPFILALGIFFIVILTLHTERKPEMRLAASGMTTK
ncbi:unnamed protein product [Heterobilharzia americana]|nr:unnamed protein product [Heterobilharzia americana]